MIVIQKFGAAMFQKRDARVVGDTDDGANPTLRFQQSPCKCVLKKKRTWTSRTWMRHLLTSLAQRALLQPEVRDSPDRRKRRAAVVVAAAGRIS